MPRRAAQQLGGGTGGKGEAAKCPEWGKDKGRRRPNVPSSGAGPWNQPSRRALKRGLGFAAALAALGTLCLGSSSAWAGCPAGSAYSSCGPGWELTANLEPTRLTPTGVGSHGMLDVAVFNVGAVSSTGAVTVTDTLPAGVTAIDAGDYQRAGFGAPGEGVNPVIGHRFWRCTGDGPGPPPGVLGAHVLTCVNGEALPSIAGGAGAPNHTSGEPANPQPEIAISVNVAAPAKEGTQANRVAVAGGGAQGTASTEDPVTISAEPARFGFAGWDTWLSNADGTLDTRAGSHPYAATFNFDLATLLNRKEQLQPAEGEIRNLDVELPPGLVGDPTTVTRCTRQQLLTETEHRVTGCPSVSQVGVSVVRFAVFPTASTFMVFDMVPPPGVAAEFAFNLNGITTFLDARVRSGGDYGITTNVTDISQREVIGATTILWGVPGDPSHDIWRAETGGGCTPSELQTGECSLGTTRSLSPFLTLPTSCAQSDPFSIAGNTWQNGALSAHRTVSAHDSNGAATGLTGCNALGFAPTITTAPDTSQADAPAGLTVEVKPPVGGLSDPEGVSTADIQNTTVELPQGLVINPGQAAGLQACQPSQSGVGSEAAPSCPPASKVGEDEIQTPLLPHSLKGDVYILQSDPPNLEILVAASGEGVNLKLVGKVSVCESAGEAIDGKTCQAPGQLITRFAGTPELPFTNFRLSFSGGPQAALATPTQCGQYSTSADFQSWADPFLPDFLTGASFGLSEGPGGGPCPSSPMPFTPTLTAGSTTDQAGGFTGFTTLLQRGDGQQRIEKLQFKEPAGLAGLISSVPLCDESSANAGTCPAASHIGHAVVSSGPGPYPLVLPQPGAPELPIYLTGPYKGAPFGLSIVTPVIAGPFNLGTVITRAKIEIDPRTAQITITTDPLPQIVKGVPTDLRSINSIIDRPNFLFNPTNCTPAEFTGTAWGTPPPGAGGPGATAPISSHFGVGSCRELEFHPKVAATTGAKASKANGASLNFNISYPKGALGRESWFNEAKFVIPKQLPSRLTTLQKACLAHVFETERQNCPAASIIGHAVVHTPVLPVALQGGVYFVSYGGAAFPDVVLVLDGYGVHIELHGNTLIEKGVTSATFRNTPDVPFESIEVNIPTGPFSEFGAYLPHESYDFCGQKLVVPTLFKAQNGLEIHQNTPVAVTGCPPSLSITKTKVTGNSVSVTVKVGETGTVKITGRGLRTVTKRGVKAGTHTISVPLNATGRAAKRHGSKLRIHAALTVSGRTGSATKTVKA